MAAELIRSDDDQNVRKIDFGDVVFNVHSGSGITFIRPARGALGRAETPFQQMVAQDGHDTQAITGESKIIQFDADRRGDLVDNPREHEEQLHPARFLGRLAILANRAKARISRALGRQAEVEAEALPSLSLERVSPDGRLRILRPSSQVSESSTDLVRRFFDLRWRYVRDEGWHTGNNTNDVDRYDNDPATQVVLVSKDTDAGQRLVAGARFTQVGSIESSLTYSMMRANPGMQRSVSSHPAARDANRYAKQGRLYDLTRWVTERHDSGVGPSDLMRSVLHIMGAGFAMSRRNEGDTAWIFLTDANFKAILDKVGIPSVELAQAKVSADDEEASHLCVVYPEEAFRVMRASPDRRVQRALVTILDAANSLGTEDAPLAPRPKRTAAWAGRIATLIF